MLARWLDLLVARGRILSRIMLICMLALVVVDVVLPPDYVRWPWDALGGFAAELGVLGCVMFIAIGKGLGTLLLYRSEDYYGEQHEHEHEPGPDERSLHD